ncbi:hypothetical protein [Streptomyces sp. NPDC014623]|uniref:hypothetical protein n=1 Tax=Streptomyces sp. NPDC014623 TaxID=3364875 RepID=UPI0036F838B2
MRVLPAGELLPAAGGSAYGFVDATLIGACADTTGAVYQPVAAVPPGREAVEATVLPVTQVSLTAATLLDRARAEDTARWPHAAAREQAARAHDAFGTRPVSWRNYG